MLFECFGVLALAAGLGGMLLACYRQGWRDGRAVERTGEPEPLLQLTAKEGEAKLEEQARFDALLANIEAYDGSGVGQREIEV